VGTLKALERAKDLARRSAAALYARAPGTLERLRGKVAILTYHRVLTESELGSGYVQPGMYVTAGTFAMHMQYLRENFSVIALGELLRLWSKGGWDDSRRYCVVTFDDGWLDNYRHALPVLKRLELPATVFVPTGFVGTDRWYWPDLVARLAERPGSRQALGALRREFPWLEGKGPEALIEGCKAEPQERIDALLASWARHLDFPLSDERQVIDWAEAEEMSAAGVTFGSHSATHRILTHLDAAQARSEIEGSWAELRARRVSTVPVFCYPNGDWSESLADLVAAAGYEAAVTTDFGYEGGRPARRYGLKRIGVHDHVTRTPDLFAFHLAGFNHAR
jgi:peptidoglycan/xylan/chitin deacetylase (PgdA/CDA1 family)